MKGRKNENYTIEFDEKSKYKYMINIFHLKA